ncbi:MAG: ABC transporter substrate-binding protein [Chloroflexota bacterium]|nr:ABC transporter substrate-binding protein [Chloroflexota bacterium]
MALVMVVSISLATAGTRATAAPATKATVTLNVASWSAAVQEENAVKKLLSKFTAAYHIKTNYQVINGDYPTAMKARITSGTAPDVFYLNSDVGQDFIQTGQIHNLDFLKKVKSYNFKGLYSPLVKGFMWKGHVYGIPKDQSALSMFYNKAMFSAAGISSPPTTWSEFTNDACKLTDKSKHVYGASLSADPARWLAFVYAAGGSLFNKARTKVTIDSPQAKQALDFYAGLVAKGCAAIPSTVGAGWNGEAFGKGLVAMTFEGNWLTQPMQQTYSSISYGVAPLPAGPKGRANLEFTSAWAMYSKTKHFKEAAKLIEFLTDQHGMTLWDKLSAYLPARKGISYPSSAKVFMEQVKYSRDWFFPPHFTTALTPIGNDIQKVMQNQMSSSAALSDMQQQGNTALNAP